jgi:hypothetical protein
MIVTLECSPQELHIITLGLTSLVSILTYKLVKFPPLRGILKKNRKNGVQSSTLYRLTGSHSVDKNGI